MTSTRWLAGVALAGALAGCGGDDGLSPTALAEQADAICTKFADRGRALGRPDLTEPQAAEAYFSQAADLARVQQEELEALRPAGDLQEDYEQFTAATARAVALLDDLTAASAEADDKRREALVAQLPRLRIEVDDAAGIVGAEDCAG